MGTLSRKLARKNESRTKALGPKTTDMNKYVLSEEFSVDNGGDVEQWVAHTEECACACAKIRGWRGRGQGGHCVSKENRVYSIVVPSLHHPIACAARVWMGEHVQELGCIDGARGRT